MIRIFETSGQNSVTIIVDGELAGDSADVVEACVRQAMTRTGNVHLFLRDVRHIDERGRALLAGIAAKGVQLSASGVYSSYVVSEFGREQLKLKVTAGGRRPPRDPATRN
jgi:hypothetical protein